MTITRPTVVVTANNFDLDRRAGDHLTGWGATVVDGLSGLGSDAGLSVDELSEKLRDADAVILGAAHFPRRVVEACPKLRVIARRGVGYDRVDIAAANDHQVAVTVTPGANDASVADHTIALMLAVGKRLLEGHTRLQTGRWAPLVGTELTGKTVGLIGYGRIGREVARRLTGFDVTVLAFDPAQPETDQPVRYVKLPELLAAADIVSLHVPLMPGTQHLLDRDTIAAMKPGAIVVNTSRGGLIDEAALLAALTDGQLGGAGLDVFEREDVHFGDPTTLQLLALPNVLATPHAAGSSREAVARTNLMAAEITTAVLDGTPLPPRALVSDPNRLQAALRPPVEEPTKP